MLTGGGSWVLCVCARAELETEAVLSTVVAFVFWAWFYAKQPPQPIERQSFGFATSTAEAVVRI